MRSLGSVIRLEREEQRLSRTDLAALSGVSAETIYEIETGKCKARIDTLYMLSEGLGVPLSTLVSKSETTDVKAHNSCG